MGSVKYTIFRDEEGVNMEFTSDWSEATRWLAFYRENFDPLCYIRGTIRVWFNGRRALMFDLCRHDG